MKCLIMLIVMIIALSSLNAQTGWSDKGGYKESIDTTGQISQIIATPDGKYLYTITTLQEQKVKNIYIQKWSLDSGKLVFSHFFDRNQYFKAYTLNLNCDAATYSINGMLKTDSNVYRLIVKDIETDSLKASYINNGGDALGFVQMEYDSVLKCFYTAYNSDYYNQTGYYTYLQYSNGFIKKKVISGDSLLEQTIASPNTVKFIHVLGSNSVASISSFYSKVSKSLYNVTESYTNIINYLGDRFSKDTSVTLLKYSYNETPNNQLALSPNGKKVAATYGNTIFTWFTDSTDVNLLKQYDIVTNGMTFSSDNKYLLANSPNDSSIYTINVGMRKISGSIKVPFSGLITQIVAIPNTKNFIAKCSDGKFRIISLLVDTIQSTYSFSTDKLKAYELDTVSFCPVIPTLENNNFVWDFGDKQSSTSISPRHVYANQGIYDVSMKVSDSAGVHTILQQKQIEVISHKLVVDFTSDKTYGMAPLTVHFINKSVGHIVTYKWDFGDGTFSTDKDPVHVFNTQRSYTIKLLVNDGINDSSITKLHYINGDDYPTFVLKTKLTEIKKGSYYKQELPGRQDYTTINIFENIIRNNSGTVFLKYKKYEVTGNNDPLSGYNAYGNIANEIYTVEDDGKFLDRIGSIYCQSYSVPPSRYSTPFIYSNGTIGLINKNLLSFFYTDYNYGPLGKCKILHGDVSQQEIKFPYFTPYYTVRALKNNIDSYVFREKEALSSNTTLCFYTDTNKLLTKNPINGYALPAIEYGIDKMLSVVSPMLLDSTGAKLNFRLYDSKGLFEDSIVIHRKKYERIYDIVRLPNNKYMLCGYTENFDNGYTPNGLLLITDEKGNVDYSKELPQWYSLMSITKMDEHTFGITGDSKVDYLGFIAVKSDGSIVGDFKADIKYGKFLGINYETINPNSVNVCFGKTMNTVFFTRNDGYNSELYVSNNPYLKDIDVSVEESKPVEVPTVNSLVLSPNPTGGQTSVQYYSTSSQRITITIVSVLGEILFKDDVMVEAGKNEIPLDLSNLSSGVAFVNVSDNVSVLHGQIHVIH